MRIVLAIVFSFLLLPAFAKSRRANRHVKHAHARHAHLKHRRQHHGIAHHKKRHAHITLSEPTDPISLEFEQQKGKLQMPVAGNLHIHCNQPSKYRIDNPNIGVDIAALVNAPVRAVYDGVVSKVLEVAGAQVVIIQHGSYYTVYNNLTSIAVSKGQHISALQSIGLVGENDDCEPILNFQIWRSNGKKGNQRLDPEQWIAYQK